MIVCVCNRLNHAACRDAARSGQCRGVGCIYRLNGCRLQCGRCLPLMREILAEHAPATLGCGGCGLSHHADSAPASR
jgi:bacterioferritin-associated ferredoxin